MIRIKQNVFKFIPNITIFIRNDEITVNNAQFGPKKNYLLKVTIHSSYILLPKIYKFWIGNIPKYEYKNNACSIHSMFIERFGDSNG